jgi:SAM-dependent methyltransferase
VGRAAHRRRRQGASSLSDIFADQAGDPRLLAEIYDLEHDAITADLVFYREMTRRSGGGAVLELGCGSGRLFRSFLDGGAERIVGVDGSHALLERAKLRIAADDRLSSAAEKGRIELIHGDARRFARRERFALVVAAGLIPHLDGPADADRMLRAAAGLISGSGQLIIDLPGPGALPERDLPLSLDWRRRIGDRQVVRRSQLLRRPAPEGLRVAFSTIVDVEQADGTMSRLSASFRLWYPSPEALARLVAEAGLIMAMTHGSHDLEPLDQTSERCILVVRRAAPGGHG